MDGGRTSTNSIYSSLFCYEKYFKETALSSFGGDKKAMEEYLEFYKEYENYNQKALQDENATFIKVPGPHAIWEYPTDKLVEAINSFIGMEL